MISFLNNIISYSFYILFFLTPLVFNDKTSELFEFNKMWLTFGLATIILASWIIKMIYEGRIRIQRTPLDIPILLFLTSQLISTFISLDPHTSLWGYYSRFNGGFLSLLTYILLYYAFVSNIKVGQLLKYLYTMILSGIVVSLWGFPSHFGYDPTCLLFRGTFDVSCWTVAFQPKVRIFSTLGQPDWLSAYLAALIPLSIGLGIYTWKEKKKYLSLALFATTLLFYLDFLYAKSRGGFVGLALSLVLFFGWYLWQEKKSIAQLFSFPKKLIKSYWYIFVIILSLGIITFIVGTSVDQIDKFMLPNLLNSLGSHPSASTPKPVSSTPPTSTVSTGELGGTDSGKIRLFVWQGAITTWEHYPIFGTGVETFAYAYYLFMPQGHNLTSEFGYLYNKAHNEYLNYLATTGIVGLGTYLVMIGWFLWISTRKLMLNTGNLKLEKETESQKLEKSILKHQASIYQLPSSIIKLITAGFLTSYIGILIIDFFGFSVVIINIFIFIFPAFVLLFQDQLDENKAIEFPKKVNSKSSMVNNSAFSWVLIGLVGIIAIFILYTLIVYWNADRSYGLGQNLINAGDYQSAYQPLHDAYALRPEPVFADELSLDDAVLAVSLVQQNKKVTDTANQLAQEAIAVSNDLTTNHPNVVTYWKTRVRIMYTLAQLNPQYTQEALIAIQKAAQLAPTDAKVSYNLGLLLGQTGHVQEAISTLQNTIRLKKDYRDAYYALGIFYHSLGVDKNGKVINADDAQKAISEMHFILNNFNTQDTQALDALKAWGAM